MGWWNRLEEAEVVLICVLHQAAEAAISAQASDWSGVRHRANKGPSTSSILSLERITLETVGANERATKDRRWNLQLLYKTDVTRCAQM